LLLFAPNNASPAGNCGAGVIYLLQISLEICDPGSQLLEK
jgi:hypothetical protein